MIFCRCSHVRITDSGWSIYNQPNKHRTVVDVGAPDSETAIKVCLKIGYILGLIEQRKYKENPQNMKPFILERQTKSQRMTLFWMRKLQSSLLCPNMVSVN